MKPIKITVKLPDDIDLDLLSKVLCQEFERRLIEEYIPSEVEHRLYPAVAMREKDERPE